MTFILAVHVPIAGLSMMPLMFGLPVVFMPVHIAFLELVIDPVSAFVFEAEEQEADIMSRPPRNPGASLFSSSLLGWALSQGVVILLCEGLLFVALLGQGIGQDQARAVTFLSLVLANFGLIVVNRSFAASSLNAITRPNPALLRIFVATVLLLTAALMIPVARKLFHFDALTLPLVELAIVVSLVVSVLLELLKRVGRSTWMPLKLRASV
jgi:Ca2+-transporting ATPase